MSIVLLDLPNMSRETMGSAAGDALEASVVGLVHLDGGGLELGDLLAGLLEVGF